MIQTFHCCITQQVFWSLRWTYNKESVRDQDFPSIVFSIYRKLSWYLRRFRGRNRRMYRLWLRQKLQFYMERFHTSIGFCNPCLWAATVGCQKSRQQISWSPALCWKRCWMTGDPDVHSWDLEHVVLPLETLKLWDRWIGCYRLRSQSQLRRTL